MTEYKMSIFPSEIYVKILSNHIGTDNFMPSYVGITQTLTKETIQALDNQLIIYIIQNIIKIKDMGSDIYKAYNLTQLLNLININLDINKEFVRIREYDFFVTDQFKNFLCIHFIGDFPVLQYFNIMEICTLIKILYGVSYDIYRSMTRVKNTITRALEIKYSDEILKDIIDSVYSDNILNRKPKNSLIGDVNKYMVKNSEVFEVIEELIKFNRVNLIPYFWNKLDTTRKSTFPNLEYLGNDTVSAKSIILDPNVDMYDVDDVITEYITNTRDLSIITEFNNQKVKRLYKLNYNKLNRCKDPVTLTKVMMSDNNIKKLLPENFIDGYNSLPFSSGMSASYYLSGLAVRYNREEILDENILKYIELAVKSDKESVENFIIKSLYCPSILNKLKEPFPKYRNSIQCWNSLFYMIRNNSIQFVLNTFDRLYESNMSASGGTNLAMACVLCPDYRISIYWYFRYDDPLGNLLGNFDEWSKSESYIRSDFPNPSNI
ncbi:Hypothetical protein ORPV_307 [Orpheovirus IHUMI-LCC2]|uniref:Uncharacterized protein n=1 Tax=Orpheovirus IHUMI-LCC2 TaxID=2023057 RepID=A0A2I2L3X0_9VIRU|nr:Hypothetical protein ORPV_307 [Orpheovirus IHUMI-LCC2]SNW62211.1 Hypothetical protein ORPV_307 [Orpheovirus IHUMI-LCC2]